MWMKNCFFKFSFLNLDVSYDPWNMYVSDNFLVFCVLRVIGLFLSVLGSLPWCFFGALCFYSLLSMFKNIKIKIYRTVILLVVSHGYETWSVTLREEHRLTMLKNWVVRKISGAKREERQETGENYILGSLIACIACHLSQWGWYEWSV